MFHVVLIHPQIPPNTGNIMRLCANTGCHLHIVHPINFDMNTKALRRAGMDYRDRACVSQYQDLNDFKQQHPQAFHSGYMIETSGNNYYHNINYQPADYLIFGSETCGLEQILLDQHNPEHILQIPMLEGTRSLNLSNCAALVVYEAWRQNEFQYTSPTK